VGGAAAAWKGKKGSHFNSNGWNSAFPKKKEERPRATIGLRTGKASSKGGTARYKGKKAVSITMKGNNNYRYQEGGGVPCPEGLRSVKRGKKKIEQCERTERTNNREYRQPIKKGGGENGVGGRMASRASSSSGAILLFSRGLKPPLSIGGKRTGRTPYRKGRDTARSTREIACENRVLKERGGGEWAADRKKGTAGVLIRRLPHTPQTSV